MGQKRKVEHIVFVAEFKDGSEHWFKVDALLLRSGDQIARFAALEMQKSGTLKRGKILRVRQFDE